MLCIAMKESEEGGDITLLLLVVVLALASDRWRCVSMRLTSRIVVFDKE